MHWARPPQPRLQRVLLPPLVDELVGLHHPARVLDRFLDMVDWTPFERIYKRDVGQPPIHPRVIVGVIIYGTLVRIHSSRALEDALRFRSDFVWLAEGHEIDHSTICSFRNRHHEQIRELFTNLVLIAQNMGLAKLTTLAFDGTRIRANNNRNRSRTPDGIQKVSQELSRKFDQVNKSADQDHGEAGSDLASAQKAPTATELTELAAQIRTEREKLEQIQKAIAATKKTGRRKTNGDSSQSAEPAMTAQADAVKTTTSELPIEVASEVVSEAAGSEPVASTVANSETNPGQSIDENKLRRTIACLDELSRITANGEPMPAKLPTTDPQCRIMKDKEGSFAPNWTPLATVDADTGLLLDVDVINHTDEARHVMASIERVKHSTGQTEYPKTLLADTAMATVEMMQECDRRGIDLLAPPKVKPDPNNPALRADPTQPVSAEKLGDLPTTRIAGNRRQLTKEAFVFSEEQNCFFCPLGKKLLPRQKYTSERKSGLLLTGVRYESNAVECAECPLKALCHGGSTQSKTRQIRREDEDKRRLEHAKKMATPEANLQYKKRRKSVERTFAVIKHCFGVRQFRTRGIRNVRAEWLWLGIAFNLQLMIRSVDQRGPPKQPGSTSPYPP
jgi:transposase